MSASRAGSARPVDIIVIPDIRNKLPFNPFEPKAPADLIGILPAIWPTTSQPLHGASEKCLLCTGKSAFWRAFSAGRNEGYYKQLLNEELNRFLSPWAYDEGADIVIGGRIYANVIINFIEQRPYVDYVANIKLFSSEDGRTFHWRNLRAWMAIGSKPRGRMACLVAARQHEIDLIAETGYEEKVLSGSII